MNFKAVTHLFFSRLFSCLCKKIKWITDIEVTSLESDNHYHYFDNRVLPSMVSEM